MLKIFSLAAFLVAAILGLSATPASAQVTINIGRPAPPPVIVVREVHHPKKAKGPKHYYYQPRPVMVVPARPVYYAPRGAYYGGGRGHGKGHGKGRH
ncbi:MULTISPECIES: hypothetical protein [unclassified Hymenobacter]|jgi:hypothetical protein|uniref:hypothetical protein n=1 Tax=unclassified Hymenobacter TaxID=2615202 RepID=UPI00069365B8|nr:MULTISPECIES: hypothetical protein [unclassified Hymenobacter]ALD22264.1 hypothetical protein AM218_14895 [Hymenobacter sp. DG25A]